jgi:hypothetical protein
MQILHAAQEKSLVSLANDQRKEEEKRLDSGKQATALYL